MSTLKLRDQRKREARRWNKIIQEKTEKLNKKRDEIKSCKNELQNDTNKEERTQLEADLEDWQAKLADLKKLRLSDKNLRAALEPAQKYLYGALNRLLPHGASAPNPNTHDTLFTQRASRSGWDRNCDSWYEATHALWHSVNATHVLRGFVPVFAVAIPNRSG